MAVGQMVTATATPLETITVKNGKPDWCRITEIIDQWQPQALVVGKPLQMNGTRQPLTESTEKFIRQLAGRYHLPIHHADERLSSCEARRKPGDVKNLDAVAAQVILESWLSEQAQSTTRDDNINNRQ